MTLIRLPISVGLMVAALALPAAHEAAAHAFPRSAQPSAGSTLAVAPAEVSIVFTERLEGSFSSLEVRNAAGQQVDRGDAHLDPQDGHRFSVSLKPLVPGSYKVIWHAVSVDTHRTEGSYEFIFRP